MTAPTPTGNSVHALDAPTRELVRFAAAIASGSESEITDAAVRAVATGLEATWVEELLLQSYLFTGFPRTLNATRAWRRVSGRSAPATDEGCDYALVAEWARRGEETCAIVYGGAYRRLRVAMRSLHPALDAWAIVEGYGKVLSRPGLQLWRRELCIVAACAATGQDRQLHAHLNGALNAGCSVADVEEVLTIVSERVGVERGRHIRDVWQRVRRIG